MEDFCNDDNNNKRTYEESNSTMSFDSLTQISKKIRRGSFFIHWDAALEITPQLKNLEKSRLCLSQNEFSALEYQLYSSRCLLAKENEVYTYGSCNVEFDNDVYIKLIRYLSVWNVLNLCIWRYHNETEMEIPSEEFEALFERSYVLEDFDQDSSVIKRTNIKITDKYQLRRVLWTVKQRRAAANTRDHFLRGFESRFPMMSDLRWTKSNNNMVREFITGLLRGKVELRIINDICYEQLVKEKSEREFVLETKENLLEKTMENMPMQRSSITDFSPVKEEVVAAILLQRMYRKRLEKLKDAVRRIEEWWEPYRIETIEVRIEIAEEMEAAANILQQEVIDTFHYKQFVEEIKDDYKTTRHPEPRPFSYWIKVISILALPIVAATYLVNSTGTTVLGLNLLTVIFYVFLFTIISYRKIWWATWMQTLTMWLLTVILINALINLNGWIRIPIWVVIVVVGKKHWIHLFLVTLAIRVGLSYVYDIYVIEPVEYGIFLYDFYCTATIAAASRQGKPIEMLQKVMINVLFLVIIAGSGALTYFYICVGLAVQ